MPTIDRKLRNPTDLHQSFILTVEHLVPQLEGGLVLAVKDDETPPSLPLSVLNHHRLMRVAGFGFTVAACLVLEGCGLASALSLWLWEHHVSPFKLDARSPKIISDGFSNPIVILF